MAKMTRQDALGTVKDAARSFAQVIADDEGASREDRSAEAEIWKALEVLDGVWLDEPQRNRRARRPTVAGTIA